MNKLVCHIILLSIASCYLVSANEDLPVECKDVFEETKKAYIGRMSEFNPRFAEILQEIGYCDEGPTTRERMIDEHMRFFAILSKNRKEAMRIMGWFIESINITYEDMVEAMEKNNAEDCLNALQAMIIHLMKSRGNGEE